MQFCANKIEVFINGSPRIILVYRFDIESSGSGALKNTSEKLRDVCKRWTLNNCFSAAILSLLLESSSVPRGCFYKCLFISPTALQHRL